MCERRAFSHPSYITARKMLRARMGVERAVAVWLFGSIVSTCVGGGEAWVWYKVSFCVYLFLTLFAIIKRRAFYYLIGE